MWQRKATEMNFSQLDQQPGRRRLFYLDSEISGELYSKDLRMSVPAIAISDFHSRVAISEIISASAFQNDPDQDLSVRLALTAEWIIKRIAAAGKNFEWVMYQPAK